MGAGALDAVETPALGPGGTIQNGDPLLARLAKLADANRGATWAGVVTPLDRRSRRPPITRRSCSSAPRPAGRTRWPPSSRRCPPDFPAAVVIAQHIAAEFAPSLADWLGARCRLPVRTAQDGDAPTAGVVLVAVEQRSPGTGARPEAPLHRDPADYPYRPSVDVLFASAGNAVAAARRRGAAHRHGPRRGGGIAAAAIGGLAHDRPGRVNVRGLRDAEGRGREAGRDRDASASADRPRRGRGN